VSPAANRAQRIPGILLVNTGTPEAPHSRAVRRFLGSFLSDPRVIELPLPLWLPLLYGVVLPWRAPRSARKYRQIWQAEGSPLFLHTQRLRAAVELALLSDFGPVAVESAFLYSHPSVAAALEKLRAAGTRRIVVLPLFPQASGTTTGAVYDQVAAGIRRWRTFPELRYLPGYHDAPDYINALAASVRDHWRLHGRDGHLLISFHGIPLACVTRGDRYADECRQSAALLAAALDLAPRDWTLSFQSRFGANRWLGPATDRSLRELPRRGIHAVTVVCPGFAADCLETLEEIAIAGRAIFKEAGGERFEYVSALNARSDHARALAKIIAHTSVDWAADARPFS